MNAASAILAREAYAGCRTIGTLFAIYLDTLAQTLLPVQFRIPSADG